MKHIVYYLLHLVASTILVTSCSSLSPDNCIVLTFSFESKEEKDRIIDHCKDHEYFRDWDRYETFFCKYKGSRINEKDLLEIYMTPLVEDISLCGMMDSRLFEISFPEGIKAIRYDCNPDSPTRENLRAVHLPNSLEIIGDNVFYGCKNLTIQSFPNNLKYVGKQAFEGCQSLVSVHLPDDAEIGEAAFRGCTSLQSANIPQNTSIIPNSSFYNCISLSKIDLPSGITTIGDCSFAGCSSLTTLVIPNSVTTIGDSAFYRCTSLKHVTISENLRSLSFGLFADCINLEECHIPQSVKECDLQVFEGCYNLKRIEIPFTLRDKEIHGESWLGLDHLNYLHREYYNTNIQIIHY